MSTSIDVHGSKDLDVVVHSSGNVDRTFNKAKSFAAIGGLRITFR